MIPPESLIFTGFGDFEEIGQEFARYFIELAQLQPKNRVLDVGCGLGRMAIPLTGYLSQEGEYWGFDIVKKGIKWCQSRISSKFSNFHFQHVGVYNKYYNPHGKVQARDFSFPYGDESFDFVFSTSVFTHMLPSGMEKYLSETSRVLKPGGKCLNTFFILNEESKNLIKQGRSTLEFSYRGDGYLSTNGKKPESAVAYEQEVIKRLFKKHNLTVTQPIHYGSWCKRDVFLSYQDIIVATKTSSQ